VAIRKVFYLDTRNEVQERDINFTWYPGFAVSQKQKSIIDFHKNIIDIFRVSPSEILEISSKSTQAIGKALSAFNLNIDFKGKRATVEVFFQSSKVFEYGGPYIDMLNGSSIMAKKDGRLKDSGDLVGFDLLGTKWPTEPKTLFYDWLYINAVYYNKELHNRIINYNYFTDIEFNHKKSVNCQAKSASLYVSLYRKGLLDEVVRDEQKYRKLFKKDKFIQESLL